MATMVVGKAELCSDVMAVGNNVCQSPMTCYNACIQRHPNGKPSCQQNTCMCIYECALPPPRKCNVGLGRCFTGCDDKCCKSKCAFAKLGGVGFCDDTLGKQNSLCQCQYTC
ncbi:defensin-like protein 182 [Prosopis cineraria]|uniref:defensin-like protein 182 n=1 Tax=Prosopis cineraria TaxID=364024 RepID=UPI00240EE252|nr:defensin-like protein 182 [Prosopis cineraria]